MANNYAPCTLYPDFPEAVCTDERLALLGAAGISYESQHGMVYFYAEDGINDEWEDPTTGEYKEVDWAGPLQEMLKEAGMPEVVIEGCFYCDKMRPGEFGGYITRITPDRVQYGGTQRMLELMRSNSLDVIEMLEKGE